MTNNAVLRVDAGGVPHSWVNWQEAAERTVKGQILWSMGEIIKEAFGGFNNEGIQSKIIIPSIISVKGDNSRNIFDAKINFSKQAVFIRDRYLCGYCGVQLNAKTATLDHIHPKSRNGLDRSFSNSICSCFKCNNIKNDRTPEEAGMKLLFLPYIPSPIERLILSNRKILSDQMDYLQNFIK